MIVERKTGFTPRLGVALGVIVLAVAARAQDLEPRAYINTPVGMNFVIANYAYSEGGVSTDPSPPIQEPKSKSILSSSLTLVLWMCSESPGRSTSSCLVLNYRDRRWLGVSRYTET